ncbi:hypothetical protein R3P38DRAFT_2807882 [Favolaschia claudopus]|uniref:Uncharacterized protein n=1 Tax=Favolaschia claudopus TaxID=2862362 RepID=A0AAV9ZHB6_9AGAR
MSEKSQFAYNGLNWLTTLARLETAYKPLAGGLQSVVIPCSQHSISSLHEQSAAFFQLVRFHAELAEGCYNIFPSTPQLDFTQIPRAAADGLPRFLRPNHHHRRSQCLHIGSRRRPLLHPPRSADVSSNLGFKPLLHKAGGPSTSKVDPQLSLRRRVSHSIAFVTTGLDFFARAYLSTAPLTQDGHHLEPCSIYKPLRVVGFKAVATVARGGPGSK